VDALTDEPATEQRDPRPEAVALALTLDGQPISTMPERTSPDRDYLWLDHVLGPIDLAAGSHEIGLAYAGLDPAGESIVDGLWLIPRPLARTWRLAEGTDITVTLDPSTGGLDVGP
jgi:hypothetical protein